MEKLFENKTTYSPELYQDFGQFHENQFGIRYRLYTFFLLILLIFCSIVNFQSYKIGLGILFLCILVLFLIWRVFHPMFLYKKESTSKKITENLKNTYSFYPRYMTIKSREGFIRYYYIKLYQVFETSTCFYLYLDKTYSFVLSKDGFTKGSSEDFATFIGKKKLWNYHKKGGINSTLGTD